MTHARLSLLALLLLPGLALAEGTVEKTVDVAVNSSEYLKVGSPVNRVSIGSSEIVDVAAYPPDQLFFTGKRVGETTATVWTRDEIIVYAVHVTYPVEAMTERLQTVMESKNVQVVPAGAALIVRGEVPTAEHAVAGEELVRGFAAAITPSGAEPPAVINMLRVPGDHQVQIEVTFAEVSRTALKQIGLNLWQKSNSGAYSGGMLSTGQKLSQVVPTLPESGIIYDNLNRPVATGLSVLNGPFSNAFNLVFATDGNGTFPVSAALSILSQRGYSRTLSEPTLVAMSGEKATFLAGGEIPVPVPQGLNTLSIEWKKFGIQLEFTPTVIGDSIQLKMGTSVSDLDSTIGLKLSDTIVPGLISRSAETTVRLKDGDSFAVAGLLSDRVRSSVDKVPGLGDLPIVGMLFRSTSYKREETELVVVVTAHIVRPQKTLPPLPGEATPTDPSDLELFLLGSIESKGRDDGGEEPAPKKKKERPTGQVGFVR